MLLFTGFTVQNMFLHAKRRTDLPKEEVGSILNDERLQRGLISRHNASQYGDEFLLSWELCRQLAKHDSQCFMHKQ
jgi:hypothetical protein